MAKTEMNPKNGGSRRPVSAHVRLAAADQLRLEQICRAEGKTKADILRQAVLEFIDRYDHDIQDDVKDKLAQTIEKLELQRRKDVERLAKLIVRATVDVGIVNQVLYKRASKDDRDKLWEAARTSAVERLTNKRKDGDAEVGALVREV